MINQHYFLFSPLMNFFAKNLYLESEKVIIQTVNDYQFIFLIKDRDENLIEFDLKIFEQKKEISIIQFLKFFQTLPSSEKDAFLTKLLSTSKKNVLIGQGENLKDHLEELKKEIISYSEKLW